MGLSKGVHQQTQACLQDADELFLTQPCKARMLYRKEVFLVVFSNSWLCVYIRGQKVIVIVIVIVKISCLYFPSIYDKIPAH